MGKGFAWPSRVRSAKLRGIGRHPSLISHQLHFLLSRSKREEEEASVERETVEGARAGGGARHLCLTIIETRVSRLSTIAGCGREGADQTKSDQKDVPRHRCQCGHPKVSFILPVVL